MAARNANRGRGGGQGRGENRQGRAGGRQGGSGASASSRSEPGRAAGGLASGASSGGRAGGRGSSTSQPSQAGGRSGGSTRGGSSGARSNASGGGSGSAAKSSPRRGRPTESPPARERGVSTGIAGGDLQSGGIASARAMGSATPRAGDVDAGLFGAAAGVGSPRRGSEVERHITPSSERKDAASSPEAGSSSSLSTGSQAERGARVSARGRGGQGLSSWFAGAETPLAMMRRMQDDLDRVFRVFGIPRLSGAFAPSRELEDVLSRSPSVSQAAQWSPQIEVFERDGNLVVHADLPAVRREDVEVDVDNDVLTIRGQRRHEHQDMEGGYRRTERSYGTFFRQIPLPEGVDPSEIEAAYQDGVLEVVIPTPRDPERARRRIEIR